MILHFPPPANWQDFQLLTVRLVEQVCDPITVHQYGTQGQRQNGVDVHGTSLFGGHLGVQCKETKKEKTLSQQMIEKEADLAINFIPKLKHFVMATTLPADVKADDAAAKLNASGKYPFAISIWSWDHFNDHLNRSTRLVGESYAAYAKSFNVDMATEDLKQIREAFDRPAFTDNFHHELVPDAFLEALSDTAMFLKSGWLRDRLSKQVIATAYPLEVLPNGENKKLRNLLLKSVESLRTKALRDNKDGSLMYGKGDEYNAYRAAVLAQINAALTSQQIRPIRFHYC